MILRDKDGNKKEQDFSVGDEGEFIAIVNVEEVKGDALLEIQTEGGAFESLLISEEDVGNTVVKEKKLMLRPSRKGKHIQ